VPRAGLHALACPYPRQLHRCLNLGLTLDEQDGTGTVLTPFFINDAWPTAFMLALGITNGYFGTMCMMIAPG